MLRRLLPRPTIFAPASVELLRRTSSICAGVKGTGPGGAITKEDALKHMETKPAAAAAQTDAVGPGDHRLADHAAEPDPPRRRRRPAAAHGGDRAIDPLRARRHQARADEQDPQAHRRHAGRAQRTAAILTTFNEVDMSQIMALRSKFKERFQEVHGIGLGFMSFFARAVVLAPCASSPASTAASTATTSSTTTSSTSASPSARSAAWPSPSSATPSRWASPRSRARSKRLANAVKEGKLGIQELSGGTFSITTAASSAAS
jgi:2-oxoglutarate dehydrogenase E2 component (dihydrolipoamide succinyltransferase)